MYKATFNRSGEYLVHFNKNHSSKNGQFASGDGDGDGIADDHHNYAKNKKGKTSGSDIKKSNTNQGTAKSGKKSITPKHVTKGKNYVKSRSGWTDPDLERDWKGIKAGYAIATAMGAIAIGTLLLSN